METHDRQIVAPYTSAEMRTLIEQRVGYAISQPTLSQWLDKGWLIASARFGKLPAFTDEDVAYNLRFVELNRHEAGTVSRRRRKKTPRGHLGEYAEQVRDAD